MTLVEDKGAAPTQQQEQQVVGSLVDMSMNTITVKQNDGTEITFNSSNCEHDFVNGMREGNWVVVTYLGTINGTDGSSVKVVKITDNDPNTVEQAKQQMNIKAVDETTYATAGVHIRASYSTRFWGTLPKANPSSAPACATTAGRASTTTAPMPTSTAIT